jgi:glycosyltransferase involved in cell wall biosynthesis
MEKNPEITVLMSVYNGERHVRGAVDSILGQTFTDFEFVIVNDGSTDGTREILESYTDPRIVFVNQENMGLTRSLNRGLAMARGKYVARQDADDVSMAGRLERQFRYMENNPHIGLVGSYYLIVDEDDNPIEELAQDKLPLSHGELVKDHLKTHFVGHGTFFFRRSVIDFVGIYDEDFRFTQDMDFLLRVSERFEIANVPEVLYGWRMSRDNITGQKGDLQTRYRYLAINKALIRKAERVSETVLNGGILESILSGYYRLAARYRRLRYRLDELENG